MASDREPAVLTPEAFRAEADVSRETLDRLMRYADLLQRWSRAINLVSRASLDDLWRRHFLDSAQLLPLLPQAPKGRARVLVDLGSGAGFPGLVLAILGSGQVHLVESDLKKAEFLRETARVTGTEIVLHNQRIERVPVFPADVVTARACAPLGRLIEYAAPFLERHGPGAVGLFLKGRTWEQELTQVPEIWKIRLDVIPSCTESAAKIVRIRVPALGSDRV